MSGLSKYEYHKDDYATIYHGNSLRVLAEMQECSVDAAVCDPPYGFAFMGKKWDYDLPSVEPWKQVYRVMKPGAHLLSFGGARTYHRAVCRIEDAGFEIRDCIMWLYGSGFPKSLDISKAIDKAAGEEREVVSERGYSIPEIRGNASNGRGISGLNNVGRERLTMPITAPATDAAKQWAGWGTALKPAHEPIVLARKPLSGTVAENVQAWGTGGLNMDGCRVEANGRPHIVTDPKETRNNAYAGRMNGSLAGGSKAIGTTDTGRFPANVIHDGSNEVLAGFPVTESGKLETHHKRSGSGLNGTSTFQIRERTGEPCDFGGDAGSAARFFYTAKASSNERGSNNHHPTVKPIALIRYLCRLIAPPNGILLDPFMGSGTTLRAGKDLNIKSIGIEIEEAYCEIAAERLRQEVLAFC